MSSDQWRMAIPPNLKRLGILAICLMKKQKNYFYKVNNWIILFIFLMIGVMVIAYFGLSEKYDKSRHICTKTCKDIWENFSSLSNLNKYEQCRGYNYDEHLCIEWQPKTKCELYPNDESCLCEEYGNYKKLEDYPDFMPPMFIVEYEDFVQGHTTIFLYSHSEVDGYSNMTDYLNKKYSVRENNKECIKSREKTECEKGNLNYVLEPVYEEKVIGVVPDKDNITEYRIILTGYNCRKKQLKDFNCSELMKPIILDYPIIGIKDGKIKEISVFKAGVYLEKGIEIEKVYDVASEKGCIC